MQFNKNIWTGRQVSTASFTTNSYVIESVLKMYKLTTHIVRISQFLFIYIVEWFNDDLFISVRSFLREESIKICNIFAVNVKNMVEIGGFIILYPNPAPAALTYLELSLDQPESGTFTCARHIVTLKIVKKIFFLF